MTRFAVFLPSILIENENVYSTHTIDGQKFSCIDEVSYSGIADDCRQGLIDHDGYSPYIVCVPVENL